MASARGGEGLVRRGRSRGVPGVVTGVVLIGVLLAGCGAQPNVTPSASTSTPAPSASPSVVPSATASPTATPSPGTTSAALPGQLTAVEAGPGGGSGEIALRWAVLAYADGYRVYRSDDAGGPFSPFASFDVSSGVTTIETALPYEYIEMWAPSPGSVEYVDAVNNERAYFRVAAVNVAGEGPLSPVVCGSPITAAVGC